MVAWGRYRTMTSKYSCSGTILVCMSMFVVLYYCFYETVLTDETSSSNLNVFGEFRTQNYGVESTVKYSKELTTEKCKNLYEIAKDMLFNGERIELPFETNNTRWEFHKNGNLDFLTKISKKWTEPDTVKNSLSVEKYTNVKSKMLKAKKYFITFACKCCAKAKFKATKSARDPGGFDFTIIHDLDSLSKKFRQTHFDILRQRRGCGYWLWKPYIILKTLIDNMSDNDLLMYQDAGAHIVRDAGPLLKLAQDSHTGIVVFHTDFLEKVFTKRDAFVIMGMDDARVYDSYQRLASFLVLRKNCQTLQFVMEWLAYASDYRTLTDADNKMGKKNLPTFSENRHDQTVLSLLSKKWQLDEFRDPSQYGNTFKNITYALGPYEQIIHHSRDTS